MAWYLVKYRYNFTFISYFSASLGYKGTKEGLTNESCCNIQCI